MVHYKKVQQRDTLMLPQCQRKNDYCYNEQKYLQLNDLNNIAGTTVLKQSRWPVRHGEIETYS
jgi:hypothetical protein